MKIRVLFLTNNPNRGSTSRPTEGWFTYLVPKGLEPVLVSDQSGGFQAWVAAKNIPCHEVKLCLPNKYWPFPFLRSLWKLRTLVQTYRIELIHCMEHNVFPVAKYLGWLTKVPVMVSVQYTLDPQYSAWAFRGKVKPARLIFVSKGSQEACRPAVAGIVDDRTWEVLYNSVDPNEFSPIVERGEEFRKQHNLGNEILIGTASALRPRKQLEHMAEAIKEIVIKGVDCRFIVAGGVMPGDEAYASRLLESMREMLGSRFLYLGNIADLRGFYNALDLYLHTSKEEGCSLSVLEAMSCGCPVIGYRSIGADEQVLPDAGEIVTQDDCVELARALSFWVSDRARREQAGKNARQKVLREFNSQTTAESLWQMYVSQIEKI